jgi:putative phage-type endonuclease
MSKNKAMNLDQPEKNNWSEYFKSREKNPELDNAWWLIARRSGIGGSDVAAILGVSKWATNIDIYNEKISTETPVDKSSSAMHWGHVLEDPVAREYALQTGLKVARDNRMIRCPKYPFLQANIDRRIVGQKKGLEVKTANQYAAGDWGEPGTDQIPEYYIPQVIHYMIATGFKSWDVAVLIGGNDFRIYTVNYNEALADLIIEKCTEFWQCVLDKTPPVPNTLAAVNALYKQDDSNSIIADQHAVELMQQLKHQRGERDDYKKMSEKTEKDIKIIIGENKYLIDDDGNRLATWATSKNNSRSFRANFKNLGGI